MNREDDLKNLWAELRATTEAKDDEKEADKAEAPEPKEAIELDALLARLEDVVSRLEEALGKKEEADKEASKEEAKEEPKKEEAYVPRRIRRPLRGRE